MERFITFILAGAVVFLLWRCYDLNTENNHLLYENRKLQTYGAYH